MYSSFQQCQGRLHDVQAIDFYLADSLLRHLSVENRELMFHSILLLSGSLREGHSCLKLEAEAGVWHWQNPEGQGGYQFPGLDDWKGLLQHSGIDVAAHQPVVFEHERLYLRRYWYFENAVAENLSQRIARTVDLDVPVATDILSNLFPDAEPDDQQRLAVANALGKSFSIISGGPGTGKTFTVTKLLAAIQRLQQHGLRIRMAAPTGKAAQRLQESVAAAKTKLYAQGVLNQQDLDAIPDQAATLHRLLGVIPGSNDFRHHAENPLAVDLLLIDEASMVDLPMMFRMLDALPDESILILIGDPDQLPSVSAGSVLADLTPRPHPGYSPETRDRLQCLLSASVPQANSEVADYLGLLTRSRRFTSEGGIGQLATQVIEGNVDASWQLLESGQADLALEQNRELSAWLDKWIEDYFERLLQTDDAGQAHGWLSAFRILCATRQGQQGVEQINAYIQARLRRQGLIPATDRWYAGCPVMVTRNDYHLDLYNGDTAVLLMHRGRLRAVFQDGDGFRYVSLSRLPHLEVVYAMTIHKTQGSEFEHVALVMPETDKLINSRELLYTAITRARKNLSLWSNEAVWKQAVRRTVNRYSGLALRLQKTTSGREK